MSTEKKELFPYYMFFKPQPEVEKKNLILIAMIMFEAVKKLPQNIFINFYASAFKGFESK
jgi:hypothetical protein